MTFEGGEGAFGSRGFFFQIFFKGLCEDTLGVSGPTVLLPAVTGLFISVLFDFMILTFETGF